VREVLANVLTTMRNNNTDAEGRLILAATMTRAYQNKDPKKPFISVDLATLTGASATYWGETAALFGTAKEESLMQEILKIAKSKGEAFVANELEPRDLNNGALTGSTAAHWSNIDPSRIRGAHHGGAFIRKGIPSHTQAKTRHVHADIAGLWDVSGTNKRHSAVSMGVDTWLTWIMQRDASSCVRALKSSLDARELIEDV
jgi:leucyl aminopeptidase